MTGRAVLFVHGGGDDAYRCDKEIVDRLQSDLGPDKPIDVPLIAGLEVLDWPAVASQLGTALEALPRGAIVVAHSLGAAAVLKLLSAGADPKLSQLFLLAPPYTGADGDWGDGDFALPTDFAMRLPRGLPITLWHSEDDETIPVESAHRYAAKLNAARVVIVHEYGHQFEGNLAFLADAIRKAVR